MKKKDRQTEIVGSLVNSSLHYLGETGLPFVVIVADSILSNCPEQHARMIIQDAYQLQEKMRENIVERTADRLAGWGSEGSDTKDK